MNELAIAGNAKRRILEICEKRRAKSGQGVIPAIMWIDTALNEHIPESCIGIGLYDEGQWPELKVEDIQVVDGFEFVLAVSDADKVRFIGKTLDYRDGRFHLD